MIHRERTKQRGGERLALEVGIDRRVMCALEGVARSVTVTYSQNSFHWVTLDRASFVERGAGKLVPRNPLTL
jgi:hypothetical protein